MSEITRPWTAGNWLLDISTCSIVTTTIPSDGGDIICCEPDAPASNERWLANARLIAAAPDMAEALMGCLDSLEYVQRALPSSSGYGVRDDRIELARSALRKAGVEI